MPLWAAIALFLVPATLRAAPPNIVMVVTDDQGYGDLATHGHPYVKTPHMDSLASESVRLDDFHVSPTCSPTRASIMTGRWANRTGVWHTTKGRSLLRENEVTLADMLRNAGYATGLFGKWHLGDNYPYRPQDRGFTEVYTHGGGAVGFVSDYWDNAYFDGSYLHNGEFVEAEGFCTDVFFSEADRFIEQSVKAGKPFFAYIATNAPHAPLHAPEEYLAMYEGRPQPAFYGMITNIDENIGRTRALLAKLGVAENTIFIFMSDNGTARGKDIFNAGMKGGKGSEYDGGHRVAFFLHWPEGGLAKEKRVQTLTHAVDLAPTLLDLAGVAPPGDAAFDGISLRPLLEKGDHDGWPDRLVISDSQRVFDPIKWRKSSVMSQGWRLVNGEELYDMASDPGQTTNVAAQHPEKVKRMRAFYEDWWSELEPTFPPIAEVHAGHPDAPETTLNPHEWIYADQETPFPVNQRHIREAERGGPEFDAYWPVKVVEDGNYTLSVRRWPPEIDHPINGSLPPGEEVPGTWETFRAHEGVSIGAVEAVLDIDGSERARLPVQQDASTVDFNVRLAKGSHQISSYFVLKNGDRLGTYYMTIRKAAE